MHWRNSMRQFVVRIWKTFGQMVIENCPDYKYSKMIICGICGNETPEKCYLNNDCPHCLCGIDDEIR